jgi:sulfatase modifying factor 1
VDAAIQVDATVDAALPEAGVDAAVDAGLDGSPTHDASVSCVDVDGDGYGVGCTMGADCDDNAPGISGDCQTNGCPQGWAYIPAGDFQMGCNLGELGGDCFLHETPRHTVTLSAYCLQNTEVSVAHYRDCQASGQCSGTPTPSATNSFCNWSFSAAGREQHPINCVVFSESQQFCQAWFGGDLPTEAQWEKGARGPDPDQRKWPWGDSPVPDCTRCNFDVNGFAGAGAGCGSVSVGPASWPVGNLQTTDGDSPYGLKDMSGNVREWTLDYSTSGFYSQCSTGCTDPVNTNIGAGQRITRGGSYANTTAETRVQRTVERSGYTPTVRLGNIGFRCRRTP